MKNASSANGKNVLIATIDDIKMRNDTEGWDAERWEEEIGWAFQDIREKKYGTTDFNDIMAYMLSWAEDDFDLMADLVCEGPVSRIANDIYTASYLGEECYLLQ